MNLELTAPISRWDEAIPLGNGLLGGLLWGEENILRLSLDRGDLWDERPAPGDPLGQFTYFRMAELVAQKNNAAISEIVDQQGYNQPHPTKIPAGRLELEFAPGTSVSGFSLDLATATGRAVFVGGGRVEVFFSAIKPFVVLRITGVPLVGMRLVAPAAVRQLQYPEAGHGAESGRRNGLSRTRLRVISFACTRRRGRWRTRCCWPLRCHSPRRTACTSSPWRGRAWSRR